MLFYLDQMSALQCSLCNRNNQTPDENGMHLTMNHFGYSCIACSSCQSALWNEHELRCQAQGNANYAECHATDRSYRGAKKIKLTEPSAATVMDLKCNAFTGYVIAKWQAMMRARAANA